MVIINAFSVLPSGQLDSPPPAPLHLWELSHRILPEEVSSVVRQQTAAAISKPGEWVTFHIDTPNGNVLMGLSALTLPEEIGEKVAQTYRL